MANTQLSKRRQKLWRQLGSQRGMIQGSLLKRYLPCGKAGCKCKRGEKHGPFYYLTYQEGGKMRTLYVPKGRLPEIKEAIKAYKKVKGIIGQVAGINRRLFKAGG